MGGYPKCSVNIEVDLIVGADMVVLIVLTQFQRVLTQLPNKSQLIFNASYLPFLFTRTIKISKVERQQGERSKMAMKSKIELKLIHKGSHFYIQLPI